MRINLTLPMLEINESRMKNKAFIRVMPIHLIAPKLEISMKISKKLNIFE